METIDEKNNLNSVHLSPDLGSAFHHGWKTMTTNFTELFLIVLLVIVANIPISLSEVGETEGSSALSGILQVFVLAYVILILAPVNYSAGWLFLKASRNDHFETSEIIEGFRIWLQVVLAKILVTAIVVFGIFLLVIPGIVFACKLAFVPYLVMDKKIDATEAVKQSWNMTKGVGLTIFFMGFLSFFIVIAGLDVDQCFICLIISCSRSTV